MEENEITTIIKEKTDVIKYAYKDALQAYKSSCKCMWLYAC